MIPIDSKTAPCTPISSNCVIWQGPDIACINLCNGDTVSDVVAKLAEELCSIIDGTCQCNPDLTGLDLSCLPTQPDLELNTVLQAIIDYVCNLNGGSNVLPNINLPRCLIYQDSLGNNVTELPLDQFATLLGTKVCDIIGDITIINAAITNLDNRVTILENCVLPCTPSGSSDFDVISSCLFPGSTVTASTLLLALETQFCEFRNVVGTVALINNAISAQCLYGTTTTLSGTGNYGSLSGWVASPSTLAESNTNQWLAICDLYAAVKDIQDNCCDTGCDAVTFGVSYNTIDTNSNGVVDKINLNFSSSNIPSGFTDCGGGTVITVTDSLGASVTQNANITTLSTGLTGIDINVSTLNVASSLTVSIPFCVSDGSSQCADSRTLIIPLEIPCPNNISATPLAADSFTVSFTNVLGSTVSYQITATNSSTGSVLGTTTITNPSSSVSHVFTGANPGDSYDVVVTVSQNAVNKTCPAVTINMPGTSCNNLYVVDQTGVVGTDDLYIGYIESGANRQNFWYNPITEKIVVGVLEAVGCYAPIPSNYSIGGGGTITITLDYGTVAGTSIETEYSTDGITWTGASTGGDGVRNIATGIASGSVYLRGKVNCVSGSSEYFILKYDFNTDYWSVLANPENPDYENTTYIENAASTGIYISQQTFECDGINYNVLGGGVKSSWYYVGKYQKSSGSIVYIYSGWTQSSGPTTIVECCVCPAIIKQPSHLITTISVGETRQITVPYFIGSGIPQMSITTPPVNGTLTQLTPGGNVFEYTHTGGGIGSDTFGVQLEPVTTGDCESSTFTIQIHVLRSSGLLKFADQPIYAFIDTNSYSAADGGLIKQGLINEASKWNTAFGFTEEIYFIPVNDSRWLGYQKSIVDNGASAILDADPAWVALQELPPSWTGTPNYKDAAYVMAFVNQANGSYHQATLASGFTGQPTTEYQEDYDAFIDALNGTQSSVWAQTLDLIENQYPSGFGGLLFPFTEKGSAGTDAAFELQALASFTAQMIPPVEYGIQTVVDLTGYLMQGLVPSATNPYQGFVTGGGNTISNLFYEWVTLLNNQKDVDTYANIKNDKDELWSGLHDLVIKDNTGAYPAAGNVNAFSGYKILICSTGVVARVSWTDPLTPSIGDFVEFTDTGSGLDFCGKVLDFANFDTVDYETVNPSASTITGCEDCASKALVTDCATNDSYVIDISTWAATALEPGQIYQVTNDGSTFTPVDGRADWTTAETKCVELVTLDNALVVEVTPTSEGSLFTNCASCTP